MLRMVGRIFGSSQPERAHVKNENEVLSSAADGNEDKMEGTESQSQEFEDASSQLVAPTPVSPKPKKSKSKSKKKGAALPEIYEHEAPEEDEDHRRDSRVVVQINSGGVSFEDSVDLESGDPDDMDLNMGFAMDGQDDGTAPKATQKPRKKNGRFSKTAGEKAIRDTEDRDMGVVNGEGSGETGEGAGKGKKTRKPRKSKAQKEAVREPESEKEIEIPASQNAGQSFSTDYSIPPDNTPSAPKSAKGKRKAKTPLAKPRAGAIVNGGSKGRNVAAPHAENSQEDLLQLSSQFQNSSAPAQPEENEDGTPERPSKKALGKRKVSDTFTDSTKKSKRRKEENPALTKNLMSFGFFPDGGARSKSKDQETQADSHEALNGLDLEQTTRELYRQTVREESAKKVSTTPIVPSNHEQSIRKYRDTPTFTPVNAPRLRSPVQPVQDIQREKSASEPPEADGPDEEVAPQPPVEDPEESEQPEQPKEPDEDEATEQSRAPATKSAEKGKGKRKTPVEKPESPEQPKESEGNDQPVSTPQVLIITNSNEKSKGKRQPEVEQSKEPEELDESAEPSQESPTPAAIIKWKPKRRLPVDEPGPSSSRSKVPLKSGSKTPKTPKRSKTPKASQTPRPTATPGRLPKEDIEAISDAIENYRVMHDLTQFEVNKLVQGPVPEAKDLWTDVYQFVPDIPSGKIHNTARRKFHNFEARGKWTEEQDEELKDAYERFPKSWKQVGELINRFPEDCRDRWRNYLVCGDNMKKDVWTKDEEDRLEAAVNQTFKEIRVYDKLNPEQKRKRKSPGTEIDWALISERMNHTRSRLQCAKKWRSIKDRRESDSDDAVLEGTLDANPWRAEGAEHTARSMSPAIKLQVLHAIRNSGAGKEGKIPWKIVRQDLHFEGKTLTLKTLFRNLKAKIPDGREMRFKDLLETLIESYEQAAPDEPAEFADADPILNRVKRKRKKAASAKKASDENDNGEGPSTRRRSERRGSKYVSEDFAVDDDDEDDEDGDNEEIGARSKSKSGLASQEHYEEEPESSNATEEKSKKKRKRSKPTREEEIEEASQVLEEDITPSKKKKSKRKSKEAQGEEQDVSEVEERPAKKKRKRTSNAARQFILDQAVEGAAEETEDDEPPATERRRKSKSKSRSAEISERQSNNEEASEIEEASAPQKKRKSRSKKPEPSEQQDTVDERPPSSKKKKKLRERMKLVDESQSQETASGHHASTQDMSEDIETALSSLKKAKGKFRKGKDKKSKRNEDISEERALDSDEEPSALVNAIDTNENGDEMDLDGDDNIVNNEDNAEQMDVDVDQDQDDDDSIPTSDPQADGASVLEQVEESRERSPSAELDNGADGPEVGEEGQDVDNSVNGFDQDEQEQALEEQSLLNSSDGEEEQVLINGYANTDLEIPTNNSINDDDDLENPPPGLEEQHAQNVDDATSTSGSDSDSDSDTDSDSEAEKIVQDENEDEHEAPTNGFSHHSPSPEPDLHNTPPPDSQRSPSPDLDTPAPNDGRRFSTSHDSPAKFGSYISPSLKAKPRPRSNGHHRKRSPSPAISSGSDSSIPARVERGREVSSDEEGEGSEVGSIEL